MTNRWVIADAITRRRVFIFSHSARPLTAARYRGAGARTYVRSDRRRHTSRRHRSRTGGRRARRSWTTTFASSRGASPSPWSRVRPGTDDRENRGRIERGGRAIARVHRFRSPRRVRPGESCLRMGGRGRVQNFAGFHRSRRERRTARDARPPVLASVAENSSDVVGRARSSRPPLTDVSCAFFFCVCVCDFYNAGDDRLRSDTAVSIRAAVRSCSLSSGCLRLQLSFFIIIFFFFTIKNAVRPSNDL